MKIYLGYYPKRQHLLTDGEKTGIILAKYARQTIAAGVKQRKLYQVGTDAKLSGKAS